MEALWRRLRYPLLLVGCILLSFLLFAALYRWDNKYAPARRQGASGGVMRLDMDSYGADPLLFLVEGWEFYQYRFLSPAELAGQVPTAEVFIGQYAGLEMGNRAASPHGKGTWRLTIFTDDVERDYALELPEIYSSYKIWVNGVLKQAEGFDGDGTQQPHTAHSMLTFTAAGRIEIVVAAQDYTHFYSGMVYPPAFGAPQRVLQMLDLRLLVHAVACGMALVIAVICLFFGFGGRYGAFPILAVMSVSFIAYSGYPLVHMLGLWGEGWYDLERMGYYAFLFAAVWLVGRICGTPRAVHRIAMGLAGAVCLSVPLFRHFFMAGAQGMYLYSAALGVWKWLVAAFLLASAALAVYRRRTYAKTLLAGICVVATGLVADRLMPWFEPVATGWFGEVAAFAFVLVIMGVLCVDALQTYRESRELAARTRLDALRLDGYRRQESLQAAYVEGARRAAHDTRSNLLTLRQYLHDGEIGKLEQSLEGQLGALQAAPSYHITPHRLLAAILADFLARAEAAGVRVEHAMAVPEKLAVDDADLAGLMGNILDNALDACGRMDTEDDRWIILTMRYASGVLEVVCKNSHSGTVRQKGGRLQSQKPNAGAHGYGTRIIADITERLGNKAEFSWNEHLFTVTVRLRLVAGQSG